MNPRTPDFRTLTIKRRLYLGAALMVSAVLLLVWLNIYSVLRASDSLKIVYEANVEPTSALVEMDQQIKEIRFRLAGYVISQLPAVGNRNHLREARRAISSAWELFETRVANQTTSIGDDERVLVTQISQHLPDAERVFDKLDQIYAAFDQEAALALLEEEWPYVVHLGILKPISRLIPAQQQAIRDVYRTITARWEQMLLASGGVLVAILALLPLFTVRLVSAITAPLETAVGVTRRIADGDMDAPIEVRSRDEVGQLLEAVAHMRQQIKTRQKRLETILDTAAEGIITFDATGHIEGFNQASERLFGYAHHEVIGIHVGQIIVSHQTEERSEADSCPLQVQALETAVSDGQELMGMRRDGKVFPIELKMSSMVLEGQALYTALISDITTRKESEDALKSAKADLEVRVRERTAALQAINEQLSTEVQERRRAETALAEQAVRDPLTGLYNRRFFSQRISEEIRRAERKGYSIAVLVCDLDAFKSVNDSRGHHAGDELLTGLAHVLMTSIRGSDLAFRWGGDEFVVVLPDTTRDGLLVAVDRLRERVRKLGEHRETSVDISIGVALYPEHGTNPEELIRLADRALYIAKKGGDKVHVGEEQYQLDDQSISVVFQPVVDVRLDQILGYEALSRDPSGKSSILALFRKYHAVGKLEDLKRLCFRLQLKAAQEAHLDRLFVNVDFSLLRSVEVPPKPPGTDVVLEISESEVLDDVEGRLAVTRTWRAAGYKFAIDDFGAGFVSLPFIARLVPDYIKLDRATILQAVSSNQFKVVLQDLIHALRKTSTDGLIAEGIETQQELAVMKSLGVYLIQGYLFGKPQPLDPNKVERRSRLPSPLRPAA